MKPFIIAQRFHFHCRDQAPGESVTEYLAELGAWPLSVTLEPTSTKRSEKGWFAASGAKLSRNAYCLSQNPHLDASQGMEMAHKQDQMLKTLDTVTVGKVDKRPPSQESAKGVKKLAVGKQATYSRTVASRKSHATPAVKRVTFPKCAKVPEVTAATLRRPNGLTHTPNSLNRLEKIKVLFHVGQKPSYPC